MKKSKIYALMLAVVFVFTLCPQISVKAAPADETLSKALRYTHIEDIYSSIYFSGTTANCKATVAGMSGTTKVNATITLAKKVNGSYKTIKTWSKSASGDTLNFSDTYSVEKGYTYRLTVSATVTRNGTTETASSSTEASL